MSPVFMCFIDCVLGCGKLFSSISLKNQSVLLILSSNEHHMKSRRGEGARKELVLALHWSQAVSFALLLS